MKPRPFFRYSITALEEEFARNGKNAEVFPIAPISGKPLWVLVPVLALLAGLLLLFGSLLLAPKRLRVEVSARHTAQILEIAAAFAGRTAEMLP